MRAALLLLLILAASESLASVSVSGSCTVGNMPGADYESLTDAIQRCKPSPTNNEMTLLLAGTFATEDLIFESMVSPHYITIRNYYEGQVAKFAGQSYPSQVPTQLRALTLEGLYFDYQAQDCRMWYSPLTADLTLTDCTFRNGSCDPLFEVDSDSIDITGSLFEYINGTILHSATTNYSDISRALIAGEYNREKLIIRTNGDGEGKAPRACPEADKDCAIEIVRPPYPHPDSEYAQLQKGIGRLDPLFDQSLVGKSMAQQLPPPSAVSLLAQLEAARSQQADSPPVVFSDLVRQMTKYAEQLTRNGKAGVCTTQSLLLIDSAVRSAQSRTSPEIFFLSNPVCASNRDYCAKVREAAQALENLRIAYPCSEN